MKRVYRAIYTIINLQFSMKKEGGVVFPVICDDSNEIVHGRGTPSRVHYTVENIAQSEGRPHGCENVHDMLQRRPFAIPYDSDGNYFRSVHQGPTDLDFRTTGALQIENKMFHNSVCNYSPHLSLDGKKFKWHIITISWLKVIYTLL